MSIRCLNLTTRCLVELLATVFAASAVADFTSTANLAFTAKKVNPYGGGPAFQISNVFNVLNEPFNIANVELLDLDVAGGPLRSIFPIDLPNILGLTVNAGVSGNAAMNFGYYVTGGRLDISYPASSKLNFETHEGRDVTVYGSYSIGSEFQPGTSGFGGRIVPPSPGYGAEFQVLSSGGIVKTIPTYEFHKDPTFAVTSPYAEAWLYAGANIRAGITAKVSALGFTVAETGLAIDRGVGDNIVEISPSGLYVAGERQGNFSLTDPIDVPLPGIGSATVTVPNLAVGGGQTSPGSAILSARAVKPILTINADLEKLIPSVGHLLHNNWGPFEYTLFQQSGGPVISLTQDMTFTPKPYVQLTFSEPVLVNHQVTSEATFNVGEQINWTPLHSNSDTITIKPTYFLNNQFDNRVGIDVSLKTEVQALKLRLDAPGLPDLTVGPVFGPEEASVSLFDTELFNSEFTIPLAEVIGESVEFHKRFNFDPNARVIKMTSANFAGRVEGSNTYDLKFTRETEGGDPIVYEASGVKMSGRRWWNGIGEDPCAGACDGSQEIRGYVAQRNVYTVFQALEEVILDDPISGSELNLGRNFLLGDYDLSSLLPQESYSYQDPAHPEFGKLFLNHLDEPPSTDIDVENHPILGQFNGNTTSVSHDVEAPLELSDLRNEPATAFLARTGQWTPAFDGKFATFVQGSLPPALDHNGAVVFKGIADNADGNSTDQNIGLYRADGTSTVALVKHNDPTPNSEGAIDLDGVRFQANDVGQVAFSSNSNDDGGVYRSGPDGLKQIARRAQPTPEGNGTIGTFQPVGGVSDAGEVVFEARVLSRQTTRFEDTICRGDGNGLRTVARVGGTAPLLPGPLTDVSDPSINNSGKVLFRARSSTAEGLFVHDGTTTAQIVVSGQTVSDGAEVLSIPVASAINNANQAAFLAEINALPVGNEPAAGIYRGDGGSLIEIARNGQTASDLEGTFSRFTSLALNDSGQVAFAARVTDGGVTHTGMFVGSGASIAQIARSGDPVPDGNGRFTQLADFGTPVINNLGHVAFHAVLDNTAHGLSDNQGIYLHDGTNVVQVARVGQALAGGTIEQLLAGGINDQMQLAYTAVLDDGREVVARFEPMMFWRNRGNGNWNAGANWSLQVLPTRPYDVFIVGENPLAVTGPTTDSVVKSLTLGGDHTATAELQLQDNVRLAAINGTTLLDSGVLSGAGTVTGDVLNLAGTISPGSTLGLLNIEGDYAQGTLGKLALEISGPLAGTQHDVLDVVGSVVLDGLLEVSFLAGYVAEPGTRFNLIAYDGVFDASQAQIFVTGAPAGSQFTTFAENGVFGIVAAVPEPSMICLAAIAVAVLSAFRGPQTLLCSVRNYDPFERRGQ